MTQLKTEAETAQFIALQASSPHLVSQWITDNEALFITLFTSCTEIALWAQEFNKKIIAINTLYLHGGQDKPSRSDMYEVTSKLKNPVDTFFSKSGTRIAMFYVTAEQFFELRAKNSYFAEKLYLLNPERIGALFNTQAKFMQLRGMDYSLAEKVFANEPQRIGSLFVTFEQFMQLRERDHSLAEKVFANEPQRIGSLVATFEQLMQLRVRDSSLPEKVFANEPQRIAAIVNTQSKFDRLKDRDRSLSSKVADMRQSLGLRFQAEAPTPTPAPQQPYQPPFCSSSSSSSFPSSSQEEKGETFEQLFKTQKEEIYRHTRKLEAGVFRYKAVKTNHHFGLKCLAGLALAGGIAAIIVGVLLAQPELIGIGSVVTFAAAVSLYGLFKKPADSLVEPIGYALDFTTPL